MKSADDRQELEAFRVRYEGEHGRTDLAKRYTSLWPHDQQCLLFEHHPERWFDGLPPFVQAYFQQKVIEARTSGGLKSLDGPDGAWIHELIGQPPETPRRSR